MARAKSTAKKTNIKINPKNKGKFTEYCKKQGYKGVTCGCINKGLKSKNPKTRKRANFARNFGKKGKC